MLGLHPPLDLQGSDQLEAAKLPSLRMMEACAACLVNGRCAPMPTKPEWGMAPLLPSQSCTAGEAELAGWFCLRASNFPSNSCRGTWAASTEICQHADLVASVLVPEMQARQLHLTC